MENDSFVVKIERFLYTKGSTIGSLSINGIFICYTLEPSVESKKMINEDIYSASVSPTPKWSRFYGDKNYRYQIRLEDKNGRKGILVHIGNTSKDTEGCILVGSSFGHDFLRNSAYAYKSLVSFLRCLAVLDSCDGDVVDSINFDLVVTHK